MIMYAFTGSNIFGQWYSFSCKLIEKFTTFPAVHIDNDFQVQQASLLCIGWSHNIFQYNNMFYIIGDYRQSGQLLEIINLPEHSSDISNLIIVSDDYHLILVNEKTCILQIMSLESKNIRTIKLTTEIPVDYKLKIARHEIKISKTVAANSTIMFLTNNGLVYNGLMGSLVDTFHCKGKPIDIQCGYEHFIILTDAGWVYTWGNGRRLQLGHGDVNSIEIPTEVEALGGIKIIKIAAGGWHSLALSEFGDVYAWGWNDTGQLGIKENVEKDNLQSYSLPTLVNIYEVNGCEINKNVVDIGCGSRHSAIILEDHTIWTTGNNKYGQLGHPIDSNPKIHYFKKAYTLKVSSSIMCGPWSTVLVMEKQ